MQDQVELAEQWKALVGVRYDWYKAEARTENALTGAVVTGPFERTERMCHYVAILNQRYQLRFRFRCPQAPERGDKHLACTPMTLVARETHEVRLISCGCNDE